MNKNLVKLVIGILVLILAGTSVYYVTSSDKNGPKEIIKNGTALIFKGEISEVVDLKEEGENIQEIYVKSEIEQNGFNEIRFTVSKETYLIGGIEQQLKEGDVVNVLYSTDQPMTMSLPPLTKAVLLVSGYEGFVKASVFDKSMVSKDNQLELKITEETKIIDKSGKVINKDKIIGKPVLVLYQNTTRSIPAQTNPDQIILL